MGKKFLDSLPLAPADVEEMLMRMPIGCCGYAIEIGTRLHPPLAARPNIRRRRTTAFS